jgi:hypothetical protein
LSLSSRKFRKVEVVGQASPRQGERFREAEEDLEKEKDRQS